MLLAVKWDVNRMARSCHRGATGAAGVLATGADATVRGMGVRGGRVERGAGSGRALMSDKRRSMRWSREGSRPGFAGDEGPPR